MKEALKELFETITGVGKPRLKNIAVRKRKPHAFRLKDDGETPNNKRLPLIVYRSPVAFDPRFDPAATFEVLFASHHWTDSWRATMYGYNHFHTGTHECLGIARGKLIAQFGGAKGRKIELKAGDVVIIPAGVGHKHVRQSKDLLILGCYPSNAGKYDEPKPSEIEHQDAVARIGKVKLPPADPVYGRNGPLFSKWRSRPKG